MAKVFLICGKICSGKSTYAEQIRKKYNAALLSVDEITLAMFGQYVGEKHDEYCENLQKYLFNKSLELMEAGINVILDWGFWQKAEREEAKTFNSQRSIEYEFHYINVSKETWAERLKKRNQEITTGTVSAYYVDENLAKKFDSLFEKPLENEIDIWINC